MDMPVNPIAPAAPAAPIIPAPNSATQVSIDDGTTVIAPTVEAPKRPRTEGEEFIDRGEDAQFEIVHAKVGNFRQGDRVTFADFGPNVDIDRLIRLEAVNVLKGPAPADAPQKPKK